MIHFLYFAGILCGIEIPTKTTDDYINYHTNKPYNSILAGEKYTTIRHKNGIIFVINECPELSQKEIICSLNSVNCPDCINILKMKLYHCNNHGFLLGKEVTFDEKCDYCGLSV